MLDIKNKASLAINKFIDEVMAFFAGNSFCLKDQNAPKLNLSRVLCFVGLGHF